jgi:hypothetical protein
MVVSLSWTYLFMYLPFLAVCASVLAATRHEKKELIVRETLANAFRITLFMIIIYAVLQVVSWCV